MKYYPSVEQETAGGKIVCCSLFVVCCGATNQMGGSIHDSFEWNKDLQYLVVLVEKLTFKRNKSKSRVELR